MMRINEYDNSISSYNQYQQKVILIDKQKQSLHYSYETLLHLLSAAENFSGLKNEQYEAYNISTATSYEELKSEFIWELHCFQLALQIYNKQYGKYYAMMNLILEKKIDIDFDELLDKLDENPNQSFNPNKLKNLIGPINHILNKIEENSENPNNEYVIKKFKSKSIEQIINESKKKIQNTIEPVLSQKEKSSNIESKINKTYLVEQNQINENNIQNNNEIYMQKTNSKNITCSCQIY